MHSRFLGPSPLSKTRYKTKKLYNIIDNNIHKRERERERRERETSSKNQNYTNFTGGV
jgi:hypothetical protein